jgi:hypothetical protein
MKVAVQIFGHLRTFDRCAPSLKENLLDNYPDHDVFLHTWDRLEAETIAPHERSCMPSPIDDQTIGAIERLYQPTRMAIEHQPPRDLGELTFSNGERIAISGIRYMFASMQRVNQLRERYSADTGTSYDVVVMVRPDIALFRRLELEAFLSYSRPPVLPADETTRTRYAAFGPTPLIVNDLRGLPGTDLLFFARPEVMTRVLKLAGDIDQYDLRVEMTPARARQLMCTYCSDIGIQTAVIEYVRPRDFDIVRC